MNIFDDFMKNSHLSGSFDVIHHRVVKVNFDDYENPDFENSETVSETIKAVNSDRSSYKWRTRDFGEIYENSGQISVPSDREYNKFARQGVKDKLQIGDDFYEIEEVFQDSFMGNEHVILTIQHLTDGDINLK